MDAATASVLLTVALSCICLSLLSTSDEIGAVRQPHQHQRQPDNQLDLHYHHRKQQHLRQLDLRSNHLNRHTSQRTYKPSPLDLTESKRAIRSSSALSFPATVIATLNLRASSFDTLNTKVSTESSHNFPVISPVPDGLDTLNFKSFDSKAFTKKSSHNFHVTSQALDALQLEAPSQDTFNTKAEGSQKFPDVISLPPALDTLNSEATSPKSHNAIEKSQASIEKFQFSKSNKVSTINNNAAVVVFPSFPVIKSVASKASVESVAAKALRQSPDVAFTFISPVISPPHIQLESNLVDIESNPLDIESKAAVLNSEQDIESNSKLDIQSKQDDFQLESKQNFESKTLESKKPIQLQSNLQDIESKKHIQLESKQQNQLKPQIQPNSKHDIQSKRAVPNSLDTQFQSKLAVSNFKLDIQSNFGVSKSKHDIQSSKSSIQVILNSNKVIFNSKQDASASRLRREVVSPNHVEPAPANTSSSQVAVTCNATESSTAGSNPGDVRGLDLTASSQRPGPGSMPPAASPVQSMEAGRMNRILFCMIFFLLLFIISYTSLLCCNRI